MKFQNPILKFVRTDGWTNGQAQSNMPLQFFQSWGHKKVITTPLTDFLKCAGQCIQIRKQLVIGSFGTKQNKDMIICTK